MIIIENILQVLANVTLINKLGMWKYFITNLNGGVEVDLQKSVKISVFSLKNQICLQIYIGDAAGRPKKDNKAKDHSDADQYRNNNNFIEYIYFK